MKMTVNIDTSGFDRAIRDIARFAGASVERVVTTESARVLETAIKYTPAAKVAKIRADHNARTHIMHNGKLYNLGWKLPDHLWRAIQAKRKQALKRKLAARGLSKQSWLNLARVAGLRADSPGYVRSAIASTGKKYPENYSATRLGKGGTFGIRFTNDQPTVQTRYVKGHSVIVRALAGRQKFFERNLREGVFTDIKAIRVKYPGVFDTTI